MHILIVLEPHPHVHPVLPARSGGRWSDLCESAGNGLHGSTRQGIGRANARSNTGKRLRTSADLPLPKELLDAELATSHGFPAADSEVGIDRTEGGALKPTKESGLSEEYKYKLQDPERVKSLARFGSRFPNRGSG